MADPIGVVGTAVGVVSFGLQIYSAVATYVDALDGRKDDLASARAQLDSLRDSLTTIQSALPDPSSVSTSTSTVPPIVTQCKKELDQLETLLQDLVGSNNSGNKLKERIKTLKFPFRRDSLMKLEDRLQKTNNVFQTALSVLNLNKSIDNERRFSIMETATAQVPAINTNVVQISTNVQDLRVDVGNMSTNVNSAISTMNSNNTEALSRLDFSVTQLTATAGQSLPQISNSIASIEQRMQSLSALEEKLQALSLLEQILGIQDARVQATPQLALQRLLAKPSQSREIYDSLSHSMSMTTHHGSSYSATHDWSISAEVRSRSCSCLYRNDHRRTSRRFASLWLCTETTRLEHDHDCELSKLRLGKLRRRFDLTANKPFSFLPWSLEISFALTTGAGGFSISPNIILRPVIDRYKSPVFRILDTLDWFLTDGSYTLAELSRSLSTTKTTILGLYSQKKAFVNETTELGESAIFRAIEVLAETCNSDRRPFPVQDLVGALSDTIVELVQAGVPAGVNVNDGTSPVSRLALLDVAIHTRGLLPILHKEASQPIEAGRIWYNSAPTRYWYRELNNSSPQNLFEHIRTEMFGCGPLSAAIVEKRDETHILDLIIPRNVSEVNLLGQTPLHLAVGTGKINVLTALSRTEGIPGILHARDFRRSHAIDYAGFHSGASCCNGQKPVLCFNCSCTTALDLLLSAEGCLESYFSNIHKSGWYFFRSASHSSKLRLFTEIKLRRDELKELALSYLGDRDIQRYKIDGSGVLDHYGAKVMESLTEMGIEVPARIQNSFFSPKEPARIQNSFFGLEEGPSIYRTLPQLSHHEAQLLFDLGFRDIDEPDELGFTPLMSLSAYTGDDAELMLWFAEHGADIARIVPDIGLTNKHGCSTVAHLMALEWESPVHRSKTHLISKIAPVSTVDGCKCYCSETGCTPASILFSRFARGRAFGDGHQQQKVIITVVSCLAEFFENNNIDMTIHRHACLSALRMLTFETLGIRHTCGCRDWDNDSTSDDSLGNEDVEYMWEEDAHLIDRLNELQIEFETSFDESGMSFNAFLVELWVPRMEIVFQELDQVELSEAERRDAELSGVKWDSCEVQHGPQQVTQFDDHLLYPETLQEYLRAIRKIAEE